MHGAKINYLNLYLGAVTRLDYDEDFEEEGEAKVPLLNAFLLFQDLFVFFSLFYSTLSFRSTFL
jgi:hypothetical protein